MEVRGQLIGIGPLALWVPGSKLGSSGLGVGFELLGPGYLLGSGMASVVLNEQVLFQTMNNWYDPDNRHQYRQRPQGLPH